MFQRPLDERGDPRLEDIPIFLGPIAKRFKERPEPTENTPLECDLLDFRERIHEFVESVGTIRQRVKTVSEEELGTCVDRKASGQTLKVDGLVGLEARDVVESPIDVLVEEPEIGCPVVDKEWTGGSSVLSGKCHETSGSQMCVAHRLPQFVISIQDSRPEESFPIPVGQPHPQGKILDILAVALSAYRRERSLCDRSPTRT